jgi:hypothetical protein
MTELIEWLSENWQEVPLKMLYIVYDYIFPHALRYVNPYQLVAFGGGDAKTVRMDNKTVVMFSNGKEFEFDSDLVVHVGKSMIVSLKGGIRGELFSVHQDRLYDLSHKYPNHPVVDLSTLHENNHEGWGPEILRNYWCSRVNRVIEHAVQDQRYPLQNTIVLPVTRIITSSIPKQFWPIVKENIPKSAFPGVISESDGDVWLIAFYQNYLYLFELVSGCFVKCLRYSLSDLDEIEFSQVCFSFVCFSPERITIYAPPNRYTIDIRGFKA